MNSYVLLSALALGLLACASGRQAGGPLPATGGVGGRRPAPENTGPAVASAYRWDALRLRGVDFVALGSEPFWALELTTQGQLRFRTAARADSLLLPLPTPNQALDAPMLRYRALTEAGELTATIAPRPCPNNLSSEVLPYTVTVRVQTAAQPTVREFAGCGRYLGDYRLHDLWALESIDGQAVVATQFAQGKPYLELNLTTEQVLGFGGCNNLAGSLTPERAALRFGPLRGPRLACPALAFEQKFWSALSGQAFAYQLENRRLTLESRVNKLVFKKFD